MNEQQLGVYLQNLTLVQREEAHHRREEGFLRDAVANMITANGLNTTEFRKWTWRVKSNAAQLKNNHSTVQLMQRTSTGALQEELDSYIWSFLKINPEKHRQDIPWNELLDHVTRQFLPSNDAEYQRETLENFRQVAGEAVRDYSRKFRDLAEQAFPTENRTPDQVRTLIRYFIKGLNSAETARTVLKSCPSSVMEAMQAALDSAEMEETLHRLGHRREEAMDVSTVRPNTQATNPLLVMSRQLERLTTKMAAMEARIQQGGSYQKYPRRQGGKGRRTPDGKLICYNCQNSGHISRECPLKFQSQNSKNTSNATAMDVSPLISEQLPENF